MRFLAGLGIVDDCNHWELRARSTFLQRNFVFPPPWSLTPSSLPSLSSLLPRRRRPLPLLPRPTLPTTSIHSLLPNSLPTHPLSHQQGKEGKLKPTPTSDDPPASTSSSWGWPDLNSYLPSLPSYDAIAGKLFTAAPSATTATVPGEVKATTTQEREAGEKALKNESWAVMSVLGKLVPSFGSSTKAKPASAGGQVEKGDGKDVDASARAKKEGTEEKFELARFYRAVILK